MKLLCRVEQEPESLFLNICDTLVFFLFNVIFCYKAKLFIFITFLKKYIHIINYITVTHEIKSFIKVLCTYKVPMLCEDILSYTNITSMAENCLSLLFI